MTTSHDQLMNAILEMRGTVEATKAIVETHTKHTADRMDKQDTRMNVQSERLGTVEKKQAGLEARLRAAKSWAIGLPAVGASIVAIAAFFKDGG